LNKKSYSLNNLLNTFSHWCQLYDKSWEHCGRNDILFKNELTKEIIIVRLIFSLQDNKLIKIPQKFNLSISTTKILISEQEYKVMNTIFYHRYWARIMQVCVEKKDLRLKLMMRKLRKNNGLKMLKIFIYYFYKKVLIKICISNI